MVPVLFCAFLLAHALIHTGFLSTGPQPATAGTAWPFVLDQSWLLDRTGVHPTPRRRLAALLLIGILVGSVVAVVGVWTPEPATLFTAGIVFSSLASAALLGLFFHPWLTLGLVIDAALLWLVLVAGWRP